MCLPGLAFFHLFTLVLLSPLHSESLLLLLVRRIKRLAFNVVCGSAKRSRHLGHFRFFRSQDCMGIRRFKCLTRSVPSPPSELFQELLAEFLNFLFNEVFVFPRIRGTLASSIEHCVV